MKGLGCVDVVPGICVDGSVHRPDETKQVDGIHTRGEEEVIDAGDLGGRTHGSGLQVGSQLL